MILHSATTTRIAQANLVEDEKHGPVITRVTPVVPDGVKINQQDPFLDL